MISPPTLSEAEQDFESSTTILLLPTLTEADQDEAWLTDLILRVGEATHHLALTASSVNREFWNTLPTERLVALLNANVARSLAILGSNTTLAGPVNASLAALGLARFSCRIPTEPGRSDITFDGKQFVYVPPVPEEVTPPEA